MPDKKNYSFYMPEDFDRKIDMLRNEIEALHGLSKSQSVYFLISDLAAKHLQNKADQEQTPSEEGQ